MEATVRKFSGDKLREIREGIGLSRFKLAVAVGCTENSISNWEAERSFPKADILGRLADELGVLTEGFFVPMDKK